MNMFPTVMIVDDEPSIRQSLKGLLSDEGFEVITAPNGYEALKLIEQDAPDLVLLDIWMPGIDGIETLKEIKRLLPGLPVLMITGHGTFDTAVSATKYGAFDFIEKPLSIDKVILSINNALHFRRLEEENQYLKRKSLEKNAINGTSPGIQELRGQIAATASSDANVLIQGENGTGKELIARTLHHLSTRSEMPLITVNCAVLSDEHIESELFGHEKGAFENAASRYRGKFEVASGGSVFLDEIGDLSLGSQAKLLHALEKKSFQRLGGSRDIQVDARIIAATNKNLLAEIDAGRFREDLYFRINVVPLTVPPLRDRIDDIPVLVDTFLTTLAESCHEFPKTLTTEALNRLKTYHWPGNVRELKNLMERLMLTVSHMEIGEGDLPEPYATQVQSPVQQCPALFAHNSLDDAMADFKKAFLISKLAENNNDHSKAADQLGISPDEFSDMISQDKGLS